MWTNILSPAINSRAKEDGEEMARACSTNEKRNEVTGGLRKLHDEELHNLYCSPSIIIIIK
jgi:hypothetical protein